MAGEASHLISRRYPRLKGPTDITSRFSNRVQSDQLSAVFAGSEDPKLLALGTKG